MTDKLWGGRFTKATDRLVDELNASIPFDQRLARHDVTGSIAHVRMLAKQGIVTPDEARQIVDGLLGILHDYEAGRIQFELADEDIHFAVERRLRERIGPVGGKLHTGRSRNDQVALDGRLWLRDALLATVDGLIEMQRALLHQAEANRDVAMPGYTHLQRAQPVLFAHHMLAHAEALGRDVARLRDLWSRLNVSPLGAGALAGVTYPLDREMTARELGFDGVTRNSLDAVADRDAVVEYLAAAALAMVHLSRLAEEVILWATAEFGFVELDDAFSTGSSIMPQKKNPDVAELVRGKTGRVIGHLLALLTTLKGLPLTYNKDMQEDKEGLFDAVDNLLICLAAFAGMVATLRVRADRTAAAAGASFALATDLADYLAKRGLPFRDAHEIVGRLVRECEGRGIGLEDLSLEDLQRHSPLLGPDAAHLTVAQALAARDVAGGTAPSRVAAELAAAARRLEADAAWAAARRAALPDPARLAALPIG